MKITASLSVLHADATFVADAGGKAAAPTSSVLGANRIAEFLIDIVGRVRWAESNSQLVTINGAPGLLVRQPITGNGDQASMSDQVGAASAPGSAGESHDRSPARVGAEALNPAILHLDDVHGELLRIRRRTSVFDHGGVSSDNRWLVSSPWPAAPRERQRQLPYFSPAAAYTLLPIE